MPTLKPRVQVTLEPETHAVIERLAELQGRTRGAVIADLLESVSPSLTRTVALLEAAAEAPEQVKKGLRKAVEAAHHDIAELAGDASRQLDVFFDSLGASAGVNPHVVTRGSGQGETRGPVSGKKPSKPVTARVPGKSGPSKRTGVKDADQKRPL